MEFSHIAEVIARFDPWWMVAVALLLILLDWFVAQSDALSAVGFSIILLAILNAFGASPSVQLWCYPLAFFASYFGQRQLFSKLGQAPVPFEDQDVQKHVGQVGALKVIQGAITGADHFYKYKEGIDVENASPATRSEHEALYRVILSDGSSLPAKILSSDGIVDGIAVDIVSVNHGTALVKIRS